jgi:hypothetical protein
LKLAVPSDLITSSLPDHQGFIGFIPAGHSVFTYCCIEKCLAKMLCVLLLRILRSIRLLLRQYRLPKTRLLCLPIKKRVLGVVSLGGSIIAVSVLGGSHTSNLNPCIWTYRWYYVYEHACLANPIGGTNSDLLQRTHTTSFFWLRKLRRYGSCKRQSSDELVQYPQR